MAWLAALLLLTALAAVWRLLTGPTTADRLMSIQMLGTIVIGMLLVMSDWLAEEHWRDVALVLALLGAMITAALVQLLRPARENRNTRQEVDE